MYTEFNIEHLFFEDLEDTYYRYIHNILPQEILTNHIMKVLN